MLFYLGTNIVNWLRLTDVPLFISNRRFTRRPRRTWPRAIGRWALDSGGFTELNMYGEWKQDVNEYVSQVNFYKENIGNLDWAAPQDWMCEEFVLKKTGLTEIEHQRRTIESYIEIKEIDDTVPVIPVIQGSNLDSYMRNIEDFYIRGVDLRKVDTVGIGSVCRRQHTEEIGVIVSQIASLGIKLHGFGVKTLGVEKYGPYLKSSDSLAWSISGRYEKIPGHYSLHKNCGSCMEYAMMWRDRVLEKIDNYKG